MERLDDRVLDNAISAMEAFGGFDNAYEKVKYEFLKELKQYRDTGLTPKQVRELQEKCNDCSRRKWYQIGYEDGRKCTSDCPYSTERPCPAASGCPGYEEKRYCCTCRWYDIETEVCCNGESDHRADFRDWDDTCDNWEGKHETD